MSERLQKNIKPPKRTLTKLLNDKSVLTGREVVQRIKDKEKLRKQFEEAVEFEVRNGRGKISIKRVIRSVLTSECNWAFKPQ
jgi:hypothetical protein